uniref:Rab21/Rab5 family GTPase putative n=1 Tax=Albugo laibachii Nc14 TaxID=890382 RepID=F0WN90_9STRA|nr:Rab21/Rab5 family GTPase putative [Albugo laibachii Nc14]|eukprot:CCA22779.1 Rab21/Rab5 family GTPase putative [Albugo laibachii Nc14]
MEEVGLDRKLVIVGATDVGKTSITMRYCHGSLTTPTSATIGASFLQKRVIVPSRSGKPRKITLQIWDTAGQERFRSMAPMYYRNAKAAILVFDLQHEITFEKIIEWLQDLRHHVSSDIVLAVVGNKSDCASQFDFSKAQAFAQEIGALVFRTSAKTGEGIQFLFESVAAELLKQYEDKMRLREADGANTTVDDSQLSYGRREDILSVDDSHWNAQNKQRKCC